MKTPICFLLSCLLLIFFFEITSCKNDQKFKSYTNDDELKGFEIPLSGSNCPSDIIIIDNVIIIKDLCDSYFFHIYDKGSYKLLGKFGKKGKGPLEYQNPKIIYQAVSDIDNPHLYVYDWILNKINKIDIMQAIYRDNYYPYRISISPSKFQKVNPSYSVVVPADSFITGTTANNLNRGRFFSYDIGRESFTYQPYYPETKITPHPVMLSSLYNCVMALKPDGEKIAVACRYLNRIDIIDKRGRYLKETVFETPGYEPDFSSKDRVPPLKSNIYFGSISVNSKFIYSLNMDKNVTSYDLDESNFKKKRDYIWLYKTDWEGHFINRMKLKPRVLHIAVDEVNQKIYGINEAYESKSLFVYNLY